MEIRLIVNGNLVHTMTMPQLQLVASKNDIFFATTAPEFFPNSRSDKLLVDSKQHEQQKYTPPSSPNGKNSAKPQSLFYIIFLIAAGPETKPLRIYRIPIHTFNNKTVNTENTTNNSNNGDRKTVWKSADTRLTVPEHHLRISRSATSSPIPPSKGKIISAIK